MEFDVIQGEGRMGCGTSRKPRMGSKRVVTSSSNTPNGGPVEAWITKTLHGRSWESVVSANDNHKLVRVDSDSQTEPVPEDEEFDWDLSDKMDMETQTTAHNRVQHKCTDAFAQTDQRIVFLAGREQHQHRSSGWAETKDAVCQTEKSTRTKSVQTDFRPSLEADFRPTPPASPAKRRSARPVQQRSVESTTEDDNNNDVICGDGSETGSVYRDAQSSVARGHFSQRLAQKDLDSPEDGSPVGSCVTLPVTKVDTAVQTENDIITDEAPEFAAKPPPCRKLELLPDLYVFDEIDAHVLLAPESETRNLERLVRYLVKPASNDIEKTRAFFRWIANNITFDWKYVDVVLTSQEILKHRAGVCRDFVKLFTEMCELESIRVKKLHGFARGHDFRAGYKFQPGKDSCHAWNAVFLHGAWRFVDCTWGTGFTETTGNFKRQLNEHFFLTDSEELIWTHFPYDEVEKNYSRWQLLPRPITLEQFNSLPKVTSFFFEYGLRLGRRSECPLLVREQVEVQIDAPEPVRYKYKFYRTDAVESDSHNQYVFCQMRETRLVASFLIAPPSEVQFFLKIYAKPEIDILEDSNLDHVVTFLVDALKVRKYMQPWPHNDVPWGLTQNFFNMQLNHSNHTPAMIVLWGSKRIVIFEKKFELLTLIQLFDADGHEIDTKGIVGKDETPTEVRFVIVPPMKCGYYKLLIYATRKPKVKGKCRLPLVASFLLDCKLSRQATDPRSEEGKGKKRMFIRRR